MLRFTKASLWILAALSVLAVVATAATPDQTRWSFLAGVRLYVGGALLVSILPSLGCSAWFISGGDYSAEERSVDFENHLDYGGPEDGGGIDRIHSWGRTLALSNQGNIGGYAFSESRRPNV